jgi:hypothetical protein
LKGDKKKEKEEKEKEKERIDKRTPTPVVTPVEEKLLL